MELELSIRLGRYAQWYGERTWFLEFYERIRKWH